MIEENIAFTGDCFILKSGFAKKLPTSEKPLAGYYFNIKLSTNDNIFLRFDVLSLDLPNLGTQLLDHIQQPKVNWIYFKEESSLLHELITLLRRNEILEAWLCRMFVTQGNNVQFPKK